RIGLGGFLQDLPREVRGLVAGPHRLAARGLGLPGREAGTDDVERDSILPHLARDRLRHRDHAGLGAAVHGLAPLAHAAGVAADGDDAAVAALDHHVEHGAGAVDEAPHVDRDLALPLVARLL